MTLLDTRPSTRPITTAHATWAAVMRQGTRKTQADACTVLRCPITGRIAAAVADGVGDRPSSAWIARVGADHAAAVALRTGSPTRAIREAGTNHNDRDLAWIAYDARCEDYVGDGDAVLAVVVIQPGADSVRVAWTGDCRVYRLGHTGILDQITTDHTYGERLRRAGVLPTDAPPGRADSIVTSSLSSGPIGTATVPAELCRRLLLASDGIGKQLSSDDIGIDLFAAEDAAEAAWMLAADADVHGADPDREHSDNIAAVVLDLAQTPTGRHWSRRGLRHAEPGQPL